MVTFWPSKKTASPRPLRNACNTGPVSSGERALKNPITGLTACCARTENGQPAVAPPSNLMNSRRLIATPDAQDAAWYRVTRDSLRDVLMSALGQKQTYAVHKGMSALPPIATAKADMPQMVMSALPLKADMCGATSNVGYGPKADIFIGSLSRQALIELRSISLFRALDRHAVFINHNFISSWREARAR